MVGSIGISGTEESSLGAYGGLPSGSFLNIYKEKITKLKNACLWAAGRLGLNSPNRKISSIVQLQRTATTDVYNYSKWSRHTAY
ncbi:unnamed protein product [Macrosiphum euphorbiae]|uniref:Uncharacterized protein n=1 Tax=Macrosiphum euphorbiae TaxID=13131 RepID=A0AAV0X1Z6_9HEMI|nr:unnamed protein product [Macrosiphum euphorbiae]